MTYVVLHRNITRLDSSELDMDLLEQFFWSLNNIRCSQKINRYLETPKTKSIKSCPSMWLWPTCVFSQAPTPGIIQFYATKKFFGRLRYSRHMRQLQFNYGQEPVCPSKLTTWQACHSHLIEATHNTINWWHFLVLLFFSTTPNTVYQILADDYLISWVFNYYWHITNAYWFTR